MLIACSFFNFSFSHLSMLKPLPSVIRQEEEEEKFLESPSDILVGKRFFFLVFRLKRKGVKSKQKILKNERNEHCMKLNKNRKPSLNRNYFNHLFFFWLGADSVDDLDVVHRRTNLRRRDRKLPNISADPSTSVQDSIAEETPEQVI